MKEFFKKLWEKIKAWFLKTAWPWIKKSWIQIVNVLVVIYGYGKLDDAGYAGAANVLGLWAFILLVYWIFWKFFGLDKVFYGWLEERKQRK